MICCLKRTVLYVLFILLSVPTNVQAMQDGIAAIVNDNIITISDLDERLALAAASSGKPLNKENYTRLAPQILNSLIDETLKLEITTEAGIAIDEASLQRGFNGLAEQNGLTSKQFRENLKKSKLSEQTIRDQIRAELAWGQYVAQVIRPQINVTDADIEYERQRLKLKLEEQAITPTDDQMIEKIGTERMGRRAFNVLKDARDNAFIDIRLSNTSANTP